MQEADKKVIHVDRSASDKIAWSGNKTIQNVLRNMASAGLSDKEISDLLGVRLSTLQNRVRSVPEIEEALIKGRSHATQVMVAKMFETAIGGNITQEIVEKINHKGQKTVTVTTREAPAVPTLMMYWLNNNDPLNWKPQKQLVAEAKGVTSDVKTAESDKIARLSREVFEGNTVRVERKHPVQKAASHSTGGGAVNERDVHIDVPGETANHVQDDALDVSTETGTVSVQTSPV